MHFSLKKVAAFPLVTVAAGVILPFCSAFAVAGLVGLFDGKGGGPGTTSSQIMGMLGTIGVGALLVLATCAVVAALLQLAGIPFPAGFAGTYATTCVAIGAATCFGE